MSVTLDGNILFDSQGLEIDLGSWQRGQIERKVSYLDGVLSIDLGGRGRVVKQKGVLRAKSDVEMEEQIGEISAFMDGNTHTLAVKSGLLLDNLRMDSFKVGQKRSGGSGVWCDYEIIYKQLGI